jgi:hypothetical protein
MTYIAAHAIGLVMLLLLFEATGLLLARTEHGADAVDRTGLVPIALGICTWMYGLFALASLGLYRPWILIASAIVVSIAGLAPARRWFDLAREVWLGSRKGRARRSLVIHLLAWLPLAVVLAKLFVHALGPSLSWDAMTYHLTLPKIYLENRGFVDLPFNVYANWPSNVQLLYGFALAVQDYVLAKLVHWAFLVLLTVAVYRFAARAGAAWAGVVAASLLLANDIVLVEAPIADIDIAVAFFFFMAVALAIEFRSTAGPRALILSGIFCGCVAGSKITGLGSIACVFPLVVAGSLAHHRDRRLLSLARDTVLFAAPAFALALPWLIKSYLFTGDPLYPVLWKYVGGVQWSDTLHEQFWRWQSSIGMGRTPRDYLLLPMRVILQGDGGYQNFGGWISETWIVLLPLTIVFTPFVPSARRLLLPAGLYFVVWAISSQQMRFLISVLPLLAAATAVTASWAVDRLGMFASFRLSGRAHTIVAIALPSIVTAGAIAVLGLASRYVRGGTIDAARNLLTASPSLREWTPDPVYTFVRRQLPPSAKIMLLNANHGFFLDREYIADSFFEASQLNALIGPASERGGLTELFRQLGVTHVLVDDARSVRFPEALWTYLSDPVNATLVYRSGNGPFSVYELRASSRLISPQTGVSVGGGSPPSNGRTVQPETGRE